MSAVERPLIYANLRKPGYSIDIDCYIKHGGYEALKKAVAMKPDEVCKEVEISGLRGRGGDRKSTRLNSSHLKLSRMPSSA